MMTAKPNISKSKLFIGTTILIVGFMSPLLIPLVVGSDLSVSYKNIISGLLAFGIPELFMIIAVAIMGKQGYEFIKSVLFKYLKRFAPLDEVSLTRYRIGLMMFSLPILFGVLHPYLGHYLPNINALPFFWNITSDIIFITSFFVLGGDFWDKLSGLFKHHIKVINKKRINN